MMLHRCRVSYRSKAGPSTSKKITNGFIVTLALLRCLEPTLQCLWGMSAPMVVLGFLTGYLNLFCKIYWVFSGFCQTGEQYFSGNAYWLQDRAQVFLLLSGNYVFSETWTTERCSMRAWNAYIPILNELYTGKSQFYNSVLVKHLIHSNYHAKKIGFRARVLI